MKRLLRFLKRAVIVVIALFVFAIALLYALTEWKFRRHYDVRVEALTISADEASIARGKGGIGASYSDADWIRALKHGLRRDGTPLIVMPSQWFAQLTTTDMAAMIAYLKTLPPVDREMPPISAGPLGRLMVMQEPKLIPAQIIDHAKPLAAAPPAELVARGQHLASIAGCRSCHRTDLTGNDGPPPGSANITPVGIGTWTKDDFFRTLRTGQTPDGRTLSETMPRPLGNMSDDELDAIWAYLKTVPAKGEKTARQLGQAVAQQSRR